MKVNSIILAGGQNKRFGRNKALMTIGGQTMIERVIDRLAPLTDQFIVVTAAGAPALPVQGNVEVITDVLPGLGPLGGIYTGMQVSGAPHNIVVACDMPFLNAGLLGYMLEQSSDVDVVVPQLENGMVEPLHSVYSESCFEKLKVLIEENRLAVGPFLKLLRVRYIDPDESRKFDPELLSFFNINYPEDMDRALQLDAESDHN